MTDQPVYLFFTSWVQMRNFQHARRLPDSDAYLATGDHKRWLAVAERRIVFVHSTYEPSMDRDWNRWREHAEIARRRNSENDYSTEVINV